MKQQISVNIAPAMGQVSAHLTPIDNQSQTAQASAQIVRKNKCTVIALSSCYTSHTKHKKSVRAKTSPAGIFLPSSDYSIFRKIPPHYGHI